MGSFMEDYTNKTPFTAFVKGYRPGLSTLVKLVERFSGCYFEQYFSHIFKVTTSQDVDKVQVFKGAAICYELRPLTARIC